MKLLYGITAHNQIEFLEQASTERGKAINYFLSPVEKRLSWHLERKGFIRFAAGVSTDHYRITDAGRLRLEVLKGRRAPRQ